MKIGIYDPYLDDIGGGEKYMMSMASCLSQEHTVDVFWDSSEDLKKVEERFSLNLSKVKRKTNIFSSNINTLQRIVATATYDALIVLSDGSLPLVGSRKLFVHIQQPLEQMQTHTFLDKVKLSRVTAFFCNSEYTKSFISKKFPVKTRVLYPPVHISPKKISKENIILHVGRFRVMDPITHAGDYKKQHIMVRAFKEMIDKGLKGWVFVLAVSVQEKDIKAFEEMEKQAKGYPIQFLVNKTNDELWDIYSKAKIYWHASGYGEDLDNHPEFAEHFGISTVEAMGAGCVPVVINAGGQREIVSDGKNGFVWNTLEEFKEKTNMLIKNSSTLSEISKKAKERAWEFSGDRFCKEVFSLVQ